MERTNLQDGEERLLQRYLLGDLSLEEQDEIEELYFDNDDYLYKLLILENELIDNYLTGNLSNSEKQKFGRNYLTTSEKEDRVRLVRHLYEEANKPATVTEVSTAPRSPVEQTWWSTLLSALIPQNPRARYAVAFTVILLMIGGIFFITKTTQLRNQLARVQQEKESLQESRSQIEEQLANQQQRNDELAKALERAREQQRLLDEELSGPRKATAPTVPSFELGGTNEPPRSAFGPGSTRAKQQLLLIPTDAKLVRLSFKIDPTGYQSFRLVLVTQAGSEVWSRAEQLESTRLRITLHLPTKFLNRGEYIFKLQLVKNEGQEAVKEYPVKIERR